jgi:hypothetical protein
MGILLLLTSALLLPHCHSQPLNFGFNPMEMMKFTSDTLGGAVEMITDYTGFTQRCPFVDEPVDLLKNM